MSLLSLSRMGDEGSYPALEKNGNGSESQDWEAFIRVDGRRRRGCESQPQKEWQGQSAGWPVLSCMESIIIVWRVSLPLSPCIRERDNGVEVQWCCSCPTYHYQCPRWRHRKTHGRVMSRHRWRVWYNSWRRTDADDMVVVVSWSFGGRESLLLLSA